MDSWKRQTFTVSPAEPGDFPLLVNRFVVESTLQSDPANVCLVVKVD